ncbi:YicC/YloC family endoribonuclease [Candidatus Riflebacteria bacterium]
MLYSLTGFGRSRFIVNGDSFVVEVKSVNNRFLNKEIRLPHSYSEFEMEVRADLGKYFKRGKLQVQVRPENRTSLNSRISRFAEEEAKELLRQLQKFDSSIKLRDILNVPGIFYTMEIDSGDQSLRKSFFKAFKKACTECLEFRRREGRNLEKNIKTYKRELSHQIKRLQKNKKVFFKDFEKRFRRKLENYIETKFDDERILTEVAIFVDKHQVDEEIDRLESHMDLFAKTLKQGGEIGRRLDFIVQELNREINTVGSKISDQKFSPIVIDMKDLLEKIREQIQNIE